MSRSRFYFLWPSIKWYFLTPQADKDIAESSRNQIKVYAQERADEVIKALVAAGDQAPLPTEYSFLVPKAIKRYNTAKHDSAVHVDCARRSGRVHEP